MIILGYASMIVLGLLPLAALARVLGVEDGRTFLLPTPYALIVGLLVGIVICAIVGRVMGLLAPREIGTYTERHRLEVDAAAAASRRRRRSTPSGIRSTAAAPVTRFS